VVEPTSTRDEENQRLRREHEIRFQEAREELQKLNLQIQTLEAQGKLEKQASEQERADLEKDLRDTRDTLRREEESRESLEEKFKYTTDRLRDLEQEYKARERRFEEELSNLRENYQVAAPAGPSPRVALGSQGFRERLTPREARVQEWRRRFQRGQEARDAYNAWLAKERESDFLWATSLVHLEDGGTIEWPSLLLESGFVSYRSQAELAVRTRDLPKLCTAADGALVVLTRQARSHGRETEAYISAKRFLNVLRQMQL
jgi:hypothetical protein